MLPAPKAHRIVSKYAIAFLQTNLAAQPGDQHVLTRGYALMHEPNAQFFATEEKSADSMTEGWPPESTYSKRQPGSAQAHAVKYPAGAPTPGALGVR